MTLILLLILAGCVACVLIGRRRPPPANSIAKVRETIVAKKGN